MAKKKSRRVKLASLIVVGEGAHDKAFINYMKSLYDGETGQIVKVDSADGGSPKDIIKTTDRKYKHTAYDRRYILMDSDVPIKSRITYSASIFALNDDDLNEYIAKELEAVRMGANTFDEAASELIIRSAQGNLRLCRNLCYGSLIEACRETKKIVTIGHVNNVLVQPHWRSHEELMKQQVVS